MKYRGYEICESQGHGKACKGAKKTATIQVFLCYHGSWLLKKQVRFKVDDMAHYFANKNKAVGKAKKFVDGLHA